ncbi:DUF4810 domain-containing protein [Snodgrassella communis]|uniref:DUF4810 domain-containing protein n=1 Tax=Snodgrassella communis TaxID=2946699 RepID=UPI00286B54FE|nr:DUF4810 domain-containing protein [Snodgrassella communis]WMY92603.1 DUF4810 domain-containing protein [Snodgrassella communis]
MKIKLIATTAMLALAACAQNQHISTIYYWGDYQKLQYQALTEKNMPEEQIASMEKYFIEASNHNSKPAPGAHAHLGMLYAKIGNRAGARDQFEKEKQTFPESTTYMNFLIKNLTGGK